MKSVADIVWEFIASKGIDKVFYVSGGGCIFLLDALGRCEEIDPIAVHHEQAAALAAEGWARESGKMGVCLVTSGPGGTNAMTGTLCSFLDSIPVMVISGNVNKNMTTTYWEATNDATSRLLRQLGDQEFDIKSTAMTMTKYAEQILDPSTILTELNRAYDTATSGRPGPVWLDIPLDVQSHKFTDKIPTNEYTPNHVVNVPDDSIVRFIANKLKYASKPLIIAGNGIRLSGAVNEFREFVYKNNIPVVTAVNGNDVINSDYAYYCGRFGTHAQIAANKIIQEADVILTIGSRLYVRQTGYNFKDFGRNAYHIHVDIDSIELSKYTIRDVTDLKVLSDAKEFIRVLDEQVNLINNELGLLDSVFLDEKLSWANQCKQVVNANPTVLQRHRDKKDIASSYALMEKVSKALPIEYDVVTSDGSANVVTMQVLNLRGNQRLFTNTGAAPMGYGLPAAIGAAFTGHNILCVEGDGSIHLNIQELQTVKHHNLPIKILLINNDGYLSIKITQKTFFNGRYLGSGRDSGLSFPDYSKIAYAYNIPYLSAKTNDEIDNALSALFNIDGPAILEVFTDPNEYHEPKVMARLGDDGKFIPGSLENIEWVNP